MTMNPEAYQATRRTIRAALDKYGFVTKARDGLILAAVTYDIPKAEIARRMRISVPTINRAMEKGE